MKLRELIEELQLLSKMGHDESDVVIENITGEYANVLDCDSNEDIVVLTGDY